MFESTMILWLFIAFSIKHLWIDFLWQPPYEWQNKGTYGHFGGIQHSGKHAFATLCMIMGLVVLLGLRISYASYLMVVLISAVEFIVHYHMDWAKININQKYGWAANTHNEFWMMLGVDQFVHMMTYVWIIWMVI